MTTEPEADDAVQTVGVQAAAVGSAGTDDTVRIDKWLWAARMFKTRSQATKACTAGRVKCNGEVAKAGKLVRVGDRIDVVAPSHRRVVDVVALAEKRGPAAVARALYHDKTPHPQERPPPLAARDRGAGRPSKRDRRLLIRFRDR
jgi:ribosome-associated heat shock protein Hsp15